MNMQVTIALIFLLVVGVAAMIIYVVDLDKNRRIEKLKEWLLLAVVQAEKELGGGTGQIKLRFVYDLFLSKFPWLSNFVSFEAFSLLVDEALDKMRGMLNDNDNLKNYINK